MPFGFTAWLMLAAVAPIQAANNFSCRSTTHPNPVILIHGITGTYWSNLGAMGRWLENEYDMCIFGITYGAYLALPLVAGLKPIDDSAVELAKFISNVQQRTGASKVDLVGHSAGGLLAMYIPIFQGLSPIVDQIIAIAPATHGSTFNDVPTFLDSMGGNITSGMASRIIQTVGCAACSDIMTGSEVIRRFNAGGDAAIPQPGNRIAIIGTKHDMQITPPESVFLNTSGVRNVFVQDFCPWDYAGHTSLGWNRNVWAIVRNTLMGSVAGPERCSVGLPVR